MPLYNSDHAQEERERLKRVVGIGSRCNASIATFIKLANEQVALLFVTLYERYIVELNESLQ